MHCSIVISEVLAAQVSERTRESLTRAELDAIHRAHLKDPLPEGCIYSVLCVHVSIHVIILYICIFIFFMFLNLYICVWAFLSMKVFCELIHVDMQDTFSMDGNL